MYPAEFSLYIFIFLVKHLFAVAAVDSSLSLTNSGSVLLI